MNGLQRFAPQPEDARTSRPELKEVSRPRHALRRTTVAFSTLALFLLFGLVAFQALIVRNQSDLDRLSTEITVAEKTNQLLRLEVAELESPERIRAAAVIILGMIEPGTVVYLEPISVEELAPIAGDSP